MAFPQENNKHIKCESPQSRRCYVERSKTTNSKKKKYVLERPGNLSLELQAGAGAAEVEVAGGGGFGLRKGGVLVFEERLEHGRGGEDFVEVHTLAVKVFGEGLVHDVDVLFV